MEQNRTPRNNGTDTATPSIPDPKTIERLEAGDLDDCGPTLQDIAFEALLALDPDLTSPNFRPALAWFWRQAHFRLRIQAHQDANFWTNKRRETLATLLESEPSKGEKAGLAGIDPYAVKRERLAWLADRPELGIPRGYLSRIVGQPDIGKSQLCLYWAALEGQHGGHTLYFAREDGICDIVSQRTEAAAVPPGTITVFDFDSDNGAALAGADVDLLRATIRAHRATLVILDPVQEYTSIDGDKQNAVRTVVRRLRSIARDTAAAIVVVQHEGKAQRRTRNDVGIGSKDWDAGCRATLFAGELNDETAPHGGPMFVVGPTKLNLAKKTPPRKYYIDSAFVGEGADTYETSRIVLVDDPGPVNMERVINQVMGEGDIDKGQTIAEASDFLLDLLSDGPQRVKDVLAAGKDANIGRDSIYSGAAKLGILKRREQVSGLPKTKWPYVWELPEMPPDANASCNIRNHQEAFFTRINTGGKMVPDASWKDQEPFKTLVSDTQPSSGNQEAKMPTSETCTHEQIRLVESSDWDYWECLDCGAKKVTPRSDWRSKNDPCSHVNKKPYGPFEGCFECLDCEAIKLGSSKPWHPRDIEAEARTQEELWEAIERRDAAIG